MTNPSRPFDSHEIVARYAQRIDYINPSGCWVWQGRVNNWGYGVVSVNQQRKPAHRVIFEALVGPIPEGMVVDHICRNRLCVNPAHLQPITNSENVALGKTRQTHCPSGHEYAGANLGRFPGTGYRYCKTCTGNRNRRAYAERTKEKV